MGKELECLERAIVDNGGWIHSNLEIKYNDETGLSIYVDGSCPPSDFLIKLTEELLVPVDAVNLSVKDNEFVIDPDINSLSPLQLEIARHMVSIYNLTDKVTFHINEDPWVRFREAPELMYAISRARTLGVDFDYKLQFLSGSGKNTKFEDFVAKAFLSTRALDYKASSGESSKRVLMPLIDYVNHDYRGSYFLFGNKEEGTKGVQFKNRQPFPSSRECYAFYGMRDGLDMFLKYGFYDRETPFVRSIPLEILIEGVGKIIVFSDLSAENRSASQKQTMNHQIFMPSVHSMENGNQQLSHLFITIAPFSHAFRRVLFSIIKSFSDKGAAREYLIEKTKSVEKMIVNKNIDFYKSVLKNIESNTTAPPRLVWEISQVAELQLSKLYKYYFDDAFYENASNLMQ